MLVFCVARKQVLQVGVPQPVRRERRDVGRGGGGVQGRVRGTQARPRQHRRPVPDVSVSLFLAFLICCFCIGVKVVCAVRQQRVCARKNVSDRRVLQP